MRKPRKRERPEELGQLVEDIRTGLRKWTDAPPHDLGVTLGELFAFLGDTLSTYADRMADEAYVGTGRPESDVQVELDDQRWVQVADLDESGPDDPHYVARVREDGATVLEFGDGERGRRPPIGGGLRVGYRRGRRSVCVDIQPGRLILDADLHASTDDEICGTDRALVQDATDAPGGGR